MKRIMPLMIATGMLWLPVPALAFSSVVELLQSMQSEVSAWAVSVKQTAIAANQTATAAKTAQQQLATANGSIKTNERLHDVVKNYSVASGLPVSLLCGAQREKTLFVETQAQRQRDGNQLMQAYASSRVGSPSQASTEQLNRHKSTYCSTAEAKVGACKLVPNGMQAWDANYAGAFSEGTLAPEAEQAAYDYVAMVTDNRAAVAADCSSAACKAAAARQLASSAATAMAADSLIGEVTARRQPMLTGN